MPHVINYVHVHVAYIVYEEEQVKLQREMLYLWCYSIPLT